MARCTMSVVFMLIRNQIWPTQQMTIWEMKKKNSQKLEIWLNPNCTLIIDNIWGKYFYIILIGNLNRLTANLAGMFLWWSFTKCMSIMNILRDKKVTCKSSAQKRLGHLVHRTMWAIAITYHLKICTNLGPTETI